MREPRLRDRVPYGAAGASCGAFVEAFDVCEAAVVVDCDCGVCSGGAGVPLAVCAESRRSADDAAGVDVRVEDALLGGLDGGSSS